MLRDVSQGFVVGCAFATGKTERLHIEILKNIFNYFNTTFKCCGDFEPALINDLSALFPGSNVGCEFHFEQALIRNLFELGLRTVSCLSGLCNLQILGAIALGERADAAAVFEVHFILFLLFYLPTRGPVMHLCFLFLTQLVENYIQTEGGDLLHQTRQQLGYFLNYFCNSWMVRITPDVFCVGGMPRRTNNHLEAINKKIGVALCTGKTCLKPLSKCFFIYLCHFFL